MDIFLSVVGLLVLLVCFWLCMASFSVCSLLACLSFCFVSCPYIRSYRFPGMFRIRSGAWHAKSAAALRCRSFPESIRRHRRDRLDIDPMAGPESSPISDGRMEDHPFPRRIDLVHWVRNRPGRPPPHFFSWILDRYRVQIIRNGSNPISDSMDGSFRYRSLKVHVIPMDHPVPYLVLDRYIGKWADPDIGSDKWSKLGLWLHSSDSSLFGPFDPWGKWSKWSWLIYSFEPIYR